jgi:Flp pilus assembly protein TadB
MKRPRLLRWDVPEPKTTHPYRDSTIMWAAFAAIIVLVAWASGGPVGRAAVYAAVFFVVACAWSWWRWRERLRRRR